MTESKPAKKAGWYCTEAEPCYNCKVCHRDGLCDASNCEYCIDSENDLDEVKEAYTADYLIDLEIERKHFG